MLIGHQKILSYFAQAAGNGTLAHAYCFAGPDQAGKRTAARQIAADLLKIKPEQLASHPDYYYLERREDEKSGKLKKDITIAQARELRARLQKRGWLGGYQAAIINEAELLNEESSNALLKVLEEPPEKSVIFLLTEDDSRLLPTIRSRAQLFYFSLPSTAELRAGLIALGYAPDRVEPVLLLSAGRPGRALQMLHDEAFYQEQIGELARWSQLRHAPLHQKIAALESLFGEKDDSMRARDQLDAVIEAWILQWRKELLKDSRAEIQKIIDNLTHTRRLLRQNVHPRLAVENAVMEF